nr:RNA polymerase beta' subunit [Entransia fimbriata]WKT05833.1 RNA polymerase beta' subunit [Entransia fimbriata]
MMRYKQDDQYQYLKIGLASPMTIRKWCQRELPNEKIVGKIIQPQTLHYDTHKPVQDGLFCERIFGPIKDWQCGCGIFHYLSSKQQNSRIEICETCEVEITKAQIRRYRMGYIQLIIPVVHTWYLAVKPNPLVSFLALKLTKIQNLTYYQSCIVVPPPHQLNLLFRDDFFSRFEFNKIRNFLGLETMINLRVREVGVGAEALSKLLIRINPLQLKRKLLQEWDILDRLQFKLQLLQECNILKNYYISDKSDEEKIRSDKEKIKKHKNMLIRAINFCHYFYKGQTSPSWMIFSMLPVLPPDLRPMIHLSGDKLIASDLNELYRKVLYRNMMLSDNLQNTIFCKAMPGIIIEGSEQLLQNTIDVLIKTGIKQKPYPINQKPLRSLSNLLEGKRGRFRQNLLGKRVDYSARSVIVVGPNLKMNQCGLPIEIAVELFQPFIIRKLINLQLAQTIKKAKEIFHHPNKKAIIIEIVKGIIKDHLLLLNRAPTLHRLGVQAFQPILTTGKAITLHPLVCTAFNADFDGDQMAVHLPLSNRAQSEALILMLSSFNLISPATGDAIITPSQDIVLGLYSLTDNHNRFFIRNYCKYQPKKWSNTLLPTKIYFPYFQKDKNAIQAYVQKQIDWKADIWINIFNNTNPVLLANNKLPLSIQCESMGNILKIYYDWQIRKNKNNQILSKYLRTTVGRIILHNKCFFH